jgi:uncharacterized membrane protein YkvA (DUF1232 family)
VAVIAAVLLYVLDYFDRVSDAIHSVGLLDDATVVGFAHAMVEQNLEDCTAWKIAQVNDEERGMGSPHDDAHGAESDSQVYHLPLLTR